MVPLELLNLAFISLFFVSHSFAGESCISYSGSSDVALVANLKCNLVGPEGSDSFSLSIKDKTVCVEKEIKSSSELLSLSASSEENKQFITITGKDGVALVSVNITSNVNSANDIGFSVRVPQPKS